MKNKLIYIFFLVLVLFSNSVLFSEPNRVTESKMKLLARTLNIDLTNDWLKERVLNRDKFRKEFESKLNYNFIKYINGNSREQLLSSTELKKYSSKKVPSEKEITKISKKLAKKMQKNRESQKINNN